MSVAAVSDRILLSSGHHMPRLHLGTYQTSGAATTAAVAAALHAGYRAIDSAAWYHNEAACGRAIAASGIPREDVFFTTKLQTNSSYDATRKAIKASLRECALGYVDLYLLHSPYGGREKRRECWRAVEDAIEAGEVKSGGVSNFGVAHLEQLLSEPGLRIRPAVNQIEVHPFNTQTAITQFCAAQSIVVQAYAPLAQAMRMRHPKIVQLAEKYGCTPAQLLVKWSLQMGYVPLPKSTRKERIVENMQVDAFDIVEEDVRTMEALDEHLVTDWDPTDAE
ncbi:NADP-dependent oxidoreductase domain-containing protein [Geopyxis carbonaria]|nr:NADP-dependent oxidoreductase domain-containing protein [Geopyxis carbonaria]